MFKKLILFHLIPISIAITLSAILIYLSSLFLSSEDKFVLIEGNQEKLSGYHDNLTSGNQAEINYFSSIKSKNQLTLFGSSEFSDSPYCSYHFFPDSLGIPVMGMGHAYHQNLSILAELLAADEYLENSKICIILSLPWFETEGTNSAAFVEFVRPNILNRIIQNENIATEYKKHLGAYIFNHEGEIDGISNNMEVLKDIYLAESDNFLVFSKSKLRQYLKRKSVREIVNYKLNLATMERKKWNGNFSHLADKAQKDFVSLITTNNLYVYDDYYTKYVLDENGAERKGEIGEIKLVDNNELNDFYLVVNYLKSKNADCSFIIQPMNPYYYSDVKKYDGLIQHITTKLKENNIPYLNLHVSEKNKYEPGVLRDIMHLGDYGWMKINSFIKETHYEN